VGTGLASPTRLPGQSILSAHDLRLEDISDLVRYSSRSITETVYRHEIRPALTKGATAMNRILNAKVANWLSPAPGNPLAPQLAPETYIQKRL
jgi:hypothetical protein